MADSLLPWHWGLVALGCVILAIAALALLSYCLGEPSFPMAGKVIVITGGSSGIGKAVAKRALQQGAHVALLARRTPVLEAAARELEAFKSSPSSVISLHTVDVSSAPSCDAAMASIARLHPHIHAIVNSAGASLPRDFDATSSDDFTSILAANVVGTRNATAAALRYMRSDAGGRVVFVSSQAGQSGIYGYTAYAASKFALSGFAQALAMEVYARRVRVSVAFPPDTDTPMLAAENLEKPAITRALSSATTTLSPQEVGDAIVEGMTRWRPQISFGLDGWLLSTLTVGFGPAGSIWDACVQVACMGVARLVALVYIQFFYYQVLAMTRDAAARTPRPTEAGALPAAADAASPLHRPLVEEDQKNK